MGAIESGAVPQDLANKCADFYHSHIPLEMHRQIEKLVVRRLLGRIVPDIGGIAANSADAKLHN